MNLENKKEYGLIGYPLGHSMSKIIHNELFKIMNLKADYSVIEVKPEELENSNYVENLKKLSGFNVTIPHKINIIPYLDELSDKAKLFGSVNTVHIKDGKMKGYNTDCIGFLRAIHYADIKLGGKVLLCGSGGVSRMFAFESVMAGADLTIAVRESSLKTANDIKRELNEKISKYCKIIYLSEVEGNYDLIINGTPVGMYPNCDACVLDENVIKSAKAVFDAIYNPLETKLIKYAKDAGVKYLNGLSMLVWQAVVAEEIWNDIKFSYDDVKKVIEITEKEILKNE